MVYKIKQLGLGGILDQAIAITRDNFLLLFTIMLIIVVPAFLIQGFLALSITPEIPAHPTAQDYMRIQQAQARYWPWMLGFGALEFIVLLPLANAAVIQAVARVYLGQPTTALEAISQGARRLPALWGTTILMYLAIWGGLILLIVPGILFALWFGLSQHVVVIEGIAGTSALKRSKKLVRNHLGTFLALGFVLGIISFLINGGSNFIPQPAIRVIGISLLQALVTMLWTAAFVVFYFSCRCAEENFDLHYLAESIGAPPAEGVGVPSTANPL
jgi:hypothetical protein